MAPFLRYETPSGPKFFDLATKDEVSIGRSRDCDIVIPDQMASRKHCVIRKVSGGYVLVDQQSKNGTTVNGLPTRNWNLRDGDLNAIGNTKISFRLQK
jgi:pSer/pThr/pTyr-binding forkhead associated (FHA) protein